MNRLGIIILMGTLMIGSGTMVYASSDTDTSSSTSESVSSEISDTGLDSSNTAFSENTDNSTRGTLLSSGLSSFSMDDYSSQVKDSISTTNSSNLEEFQNKYNSTASELKSSMPTLESTSLDDLRTELTDSVKTNASSTLKSLMSNSFTSLNSSLYNVSLPSTDTSSLESLNVNFAEMKESYNNALKELSDTSTSTNTSSTKKIGTFSEELSNWRNSSSYKAVSGKISISNVFGSLTKQLPTSSSKK